MEISAKEVILFGLSLLILFSIADQINKEMKDEISLPLKALVVKGELGGERNEENITKLVENANKVWQKANVSFGLTKIETVEINSDVINTALKGNGNVLADVSGYDSNAINIFFIKNMSHNGISFPEQKIVVMPDKTTNLEYVAAAHELGHILGLGHNAQEKYLMFAVCNGTAISLTETLDARRNAKTLLVGFNSHIVLPSTVVEFTVVGCR